MPMYRGSAVGKCCANTYLTLTLIHNLTPNLRSDFGDLWLYDNKAGLYNSEADSCDDEARACDSQAGSCDCKAGKC